GVLELQRRRAAAIPKRKAATRLVSGAWRAARCIAETSCSDCASETILLRRSTAALRPAVTSATERDTSVAVSVARSVMPGCSVGCDSNSSSMPHRIWHEVRQPLAIRACAFFERRVESTFGYPRQAPY